MLAVVFKQDSIRWRIELLSQRIQEWWEVLLSQLTNNTPDIPQWDFDAEWIRQLIKILLWSIIAAILVWLTWQFWLLIRPYWLKWQKSSSTLAKVNDTDSEKILSVNEWLAQSHYYQQQRDYRQAIFCLYQATIQTLCDRNLIPILSSRTDREYLDLIKNSSTLESQAYELLFKTHEKLCFSDLDASRSLWEKYQQAYQLIVNKKQ